MDALQMILMAIVHTRNVTLPEMGTLHGEKPWTSQTVLGPWGPWVLVKNWRFFGLFSSRAI
jgi:hypothetical protein